jgi:dihydroneopterin aldolase
VSDTDRIELHGLRVVASVGALPEEHERRQPLEIDLDLAVDLAPAGASDDLADTVDYGLVCQRVEELVVGGGHTVLLESLAEKIAARVLGLDDRIAGVTVIVRKLRPPVPQDLATSGVRISRSR